jgi:hypothetical protein
MTSLSKKVIGRGDVKKLSELTSNQHNSANLPHDPGAIGSIGKKKGNSAALDHALRFN